MTEERKLTIDRILNASPERVFAAWTDTEQLAQWYGPEGMSCEIFENDVKPGGRYALVMRSQEGEYYLSGTYEEIDPPHRLVMTWKWKTSDETTRVSVELLPEGEGTHLGLTHSEFSEEEQVSSHNQGWTSSLNELERYLSDAG